MEADWSYEKWHNRLEAAIRGTSEEDAYEVIYDIYGTAHTDGYHEGFGEGKVHDCEHKCEGSEDPRCG
jgi:hypothetical protein